MIDSRESPRQQHVDEVIDALHMAAQHHWRTDDLQYLILMQDQVVRGKERKRGELMLFDFADWRQSDKTWDITRHIGTLRQHLL